jgi:hypothetical protein
MADATEHLLGDLQALVTKLEKQDELAIRISKLMAPNVSIMRWYDRPILVGFLGVLVAAIAPITTTINAYIQKDTDLQLAQQRLEYEISSGYLSSYAVKEALTQALNPSLSLAHRARALRFLEIVVKNEKVHDWVKSEMRIASEYEDIKADDVLFGDEAESSSADLFALKIEDQKNPRKSRIKIKREVSRILNDPNLPDDEKLPRLKALRERLEALSVTLGKGIGALRERNPDFTAPLKDSTRYR